MENKIKALKNLLTALKTRNEVLTEEMKKNEASIQEVEDELTILSDESLKNL